MEYVADQGSRNVICGIIRQAIKDWKNAYYVLNKGLTAEECEAILENNPKNKVAKRRLCQINRANYVKYETEAFFKSNWYKELKESSGVALPKDILSALYEKVQKEKRNMSNNELIELITKLDMEIDRLEEMGNKRLKEAIKYLYEAREELDRLREEV